MTRTTFFKHFELLADQPDAVAKMRELVLQLAVRGQLVGQNGKDEPAHKLVDRARKAWTERKIRERETSEALEPPHTLPAGWVWACLDEIGDTNPRNDAADNLEVGFVPMKLISAGYGEPVAFEVKPWGEVKKGFTHFADGDVVLAKITPCFENGKSAVIPKLKNGIGAGTTELHVFRQYSGCVVPDYVLIFFKTPRFINEGVPRMTGSAGQKRVPWDYFANTPFPLPPLAEQRRIVAKVDELMALCDELEQRQQARQHASGLLQQSALHHLLAAREPQTFAAAWQRVRDHFHLLHDTPDALPQLRQAILQLAVQGQLTRQASTSVEIAGIKRIDPPLLSPKHWTWINLGDALQYGPSNGLSLKPVKFQTATRALILSATTSGTFKPEHFKYIDQTIPPDSEYWLRDGDVLIQRGNSLEYVGTAAVYRGKPNQFIFPDLMIKFRLKAEIIPEFAHFVFNSLFGRSYFQSRATGTAGTMPKINQGVLKNFPFPLPPLAEQKRIVARVEELLRWCDTLEAQLHQTRTLGAHLLASTLHHLLAA